MCGVRSPVCTSRGQKRALAHSFILFPVPLRQGFFLNLGLKFLLGWRCYSDPPVCFFWSWDYRNL